MSQHIRLALLALVLGTASATPASALSLDVSQLVLGNEFVGQTTPVQTVTLTNDGSVAVAILGLSILGAHSADFDVSLDLSTAAWGRVGN